MKLPYVPSKPIFSLAASHSPASRTPPPANDAGLPTSATCGRTPLESFGKWDPDTSCWRTFQASLLTDTLEPLSGSWPVSGMTLSGTLYRLPPLVPRTSVGAGGAWPTPQVIDLPQTNANTKRWGGLNSLTLMAEQTKWPTPMSSVKGASQRERDEGNPKMRLETEAEMWTTPTGDDTGARKAKYAQGGTALSAQARWATPVASEGEHGGPNRRIGSKGDPGLSMQAYQYGHPPQTTPKDGPESSQPTRRLNPLFVNWMQGLPRGWVGLEPIESSSYERWETAWCRRLSRIFSGA